MRDRKYVLADIRSGMKYAIQCCRDAVAGDNVFFVMEAWKALGQLQSELTTLYQIDLDLGRRYHMRVAKLERLLRSRIAPLVVRFYR